MDDLEPGEAIAVDWTAAEYHADQSYMSRSRLAPLPKDPAMFIARERGLLNFTPTKAMMFGTHVHLAVLEPDEWARRLMRPEPGRPPGADGRRKIRDADDPNDPRALYDAWKSDVEGWEAEVAAHPDPIVLDAESLDRVESCAGALLAHPDVAQIFAMPGASEQTVLWRCPDPDVLVRVRWDRVAFPDESTVVILDVKTTHDPSPDRFGIQVHRDGLDRQGALYIDAAQALHPGKSVHFIFAAVRSSAPWEVACYELEGDEYELGRNRSRAALRDYARRRRDNDWLADWQRSINRITLPAWSYREDQ